MTMKTQVWDRGKKKYSTLTVNKQMTNSPPKKKTKQTTEDVLASRRNTKKANKKAEKDSPAGTDIHTIT